MSFIGPTTMEGWSGVPVAERLAEVTALPAFVETDNAAAALGECLYGAGRQFRDFYYLYFGVGLGGSMVIDGFPVRGAHRNAGEIGHVPMVVNGRPCSCGNRGCLERYLSLEAYGRRAPIIGREAWIAEAAPLLRNAVVTIENLFDPETIVIGGIAGDDLLQELMAAAEPLPTSISERKAREAPRLMRSGSGPGAVLRGAGSLAFSGALSPRFGTLFAQAGGQQKDPVFARSPCRMSFPPLLELDEIAMNFGAIEALKGVSFSVGKGEVVALLGDNGAGKSTLVKIISGGLKASAGRMVFDGSEQFFATPADAKAHGIETVYQDLSLCTNVDVVGNFFMGREIVKKWLGLVPVLQEKEMEQVVAQALSNAGTRIPSLRTNVEHLSGGQRQAIELNRFAHWGGKLVLLDEPFAALGVEQTRRGLDLIKRIAAQGIGVIIITHIMHRPSRWRTASWSSARGGWRATCRRAKRAPTRSWA